MLYFCRSQQLCSENIEAGSANWPIRDEFRGQLVLFDSKHKACIITEVVVELCFSVVKESHGFIPIYLVLLTYDIGGRAGCELIRTYCDSTQQEAK